MSEQISIIECTRCKDPQVFKPNMKDDEIPVALSVYIDGGYQMFIDNIFNSEEYEWMLCHKCAHEFVKWIGVPMDRKHPHTGDDFCTGWTREWFEEQYRLETQYVQDELDKRREAKHGKE